MTVDFDEHNSSLRNRDRVTLFADDFGGVSGIRGTGITVFGIPVPPYFHFIISRFEKLGYKIGRDLFGAPYDWRFGAAQPESYFDNLKNLIEQAYQTNNHSVSILAHSLGCQITHLLLTEKTTAEWRQKYINTTTYIAPSWSGSGTSFNTLWRIQSGVFAMLNLRQITEFARSLGTLHIHIPHQLGYANKTLFEDEEGNNFTGKDLVGILVKHGKLDEKSLRIAEGNFAFLRKWPVVPDVNVTILYNSGMKTPIGLSLKSSRRFGKQIYGPGDGLVGSAVIEWVCQNWGTGVKCHDVKSPKGKYSHKNMLFSKETINIVIEWLVGKEAVPVGSKFWARLREL
jgi:lecithin-cholesterol acyltransferase